MRIAAVAMAMAVTGCVHRSDEDQIFAALSSPTESGLSCPAPGANAVHGPLMKRLETIRGDSAFATLMMDCVQQSAPCPSGQTCAASGVVRVATTYLLIRRHGKWEVERPISGAVMHPG